MPRRSLSKGKFDFILNAEQDESLKEYGVLHLREKEELEPSDGHKKE